MSKFKESLIDLGEVKEREYINVEFESTDDISEDINFYTGYCGGCIDIEKYENNKLYVKLYTGIIPLHLEVNRHEIYKSFDVVYKDETSESLTIKATIIK